jgi:SAM-dependent methyltransferase
MYEYTCNIPGTSEVAMCLLGDLSGRNVLDMGCYQGETSREMAAAGAEVWSCDLLTWEGVQSLQHFQCVDLNEALNYSDAQFDAILCTDVIEHLERPQRMLRECARILKLGGTLILSTPNTSNVVSRLSFLLRGEFLLHRRYHFDHWGHIFPVTMSWLQAAAEMEGFVIECVVSEDNSEKLKRKLIRFAMYPIHFAVRNQFGARCYGQTLIVRLRRIER